MKLILFPYAGGQENSYSKLTKHFSNTTIYKPCGRGRRYAEPSLENIHDIVEDAYRQLRKHFKAPFVFYGHSMGCIVAFLLSRKLFLKKSPLPRALICSGRNAPTTPPKKDKIHLYGRERLIEKLREFGGCPEQLLEQQEIFQEFEGPIRADFKALENYTYDKGPIFDFPILHIYGTDDYSNNTNVEDWRHETYGKFHKVAFRGGHFFINDLPEEVSQCIRQFMNNLLDISPQY